MKVPGIKILILDLETRPNLAYTWGIWDQTVGLSQLIEPVSVLCWAAKWLGDDTMHFGSVQTGKPLQMLGKIHRLLDQADVVIGYNSKAFDVKHLFREFLIHGFDPPSPFRQVDLLQTARSKFKFQSNKLTYLLPALGLGQKAETGGFDLWKKVMANDKEAWKKMRFYNETDVLETEKLYMKLRPWIAGHTNITLYQAEKEACPTCGSEEFQKRGFYVANSYKYQKFSCNSCKTWFRGGKSEGGKQVKYARAQ